MNKPAEKPRRENKPSVPNKVPATKPVSKFGSGVKKSAGRTGSRPVAPPKAHEYMPPLESSVKRKKQHHPVWRAIAWLSLTLGLLAVAYFGYAVFTSRSLHQSRNIFTRVTQPIDPKAKFGKILSTEATTTYDATTTKQLIAQTNKTYTQPVTQGITKQLIRYTSSDEEGREVSVYARVYVPAKATANGSAPVYAFAPGTTGIDDHCAASLEKPAVANWANYDSLMAAYAAQGYVVVITDYEGMRDSSRMHHYMVGPMEGRAVLDSVRALTNLESTKNVINLNNTFVAGYSQGGHAALWADQIAPDYAPELEIKGLVGFGPVTDVGTTLTDITRGANINWFGPFVLYSYQDFYRKDYNLNSYLLPKWQQSLSSDIAANCINTLIPHWGKVPAAVYQPEFLAALTRGDLSGNYADLAKDMAKNRAGTVGTSTPKLINHGQRDNVVLPSQSQAFLQRACSIADGPIKLTIYPTATHYDTMVQSYNDTLAWMKALMASQPAPTSCQS